MNDENGIGDHANRQIAEIQRRVTADRILEEVSKDLHAAPIGWSKLDVDDRGRLISGWRAKIVAELERHF